MTYQINNKYKKNKRKNNSFNEIPFRSHLSIAGFIGTAYLGATIAINTLLIGTQYIAEQIEQQICPKEVTEVTLTLKNKQEMILPSTKGKYIRGTFETLEGKTIQLLEPSRISVGKLFPNRELEKMKIDSSYTIRITGTKNNYSLVSLID